ncbi:hypothetical protein EON65_23180 [archaeon]|nr:MAG: hypothetical protein EON65_23180 [archaeon]
MNQPIAPSNPKPSRGRTGVSQQHRVVASENASTTHPYIDKVSKTTVPPSLTIDAEDEKTRTDSPSHLLHRGSISMGTGRSRVLFCVDDDNIDLELNDSNDDVQNGAGLVGLAPEGDRSDSPANTVNTVDTNDNSIDATNTLTFVPETKTTAAITEALTQPLPRRAVRRATKADIKFAYLEQTLSQVKLDEELQETIVEKAKDAEVWSSESEEDEEKNKKTGRNNKFYSNAGKKKPSAVKSILQKGKNDKNKKGDKKDEARAVVVGRAVEELAKLKKQRDTSEQQFLKTLSKEIPPAKKMVAHKMTVRIYERVLKKQVDAFLTRYV